jgi:hypothetical protein
LWLGKLNGPAVCKALYSPLIEEEDKDSFIFTNLFESVPEDLTESLRIAPAIFQRAILSKVDYRVTVVGERVFAARIDVSESILDWRTAKASVGFTLCDLPAVIHNRCREYVSAANLAFGAIDLVESNGEFYSWRSIQMENGGGLKGLTVSLSHQHCVIFCRGVSRVRQVLSILWPPYELYLATQTQQTQSCNGTWEKSLEKLKIEISGNRKRMSPTRKRLRQVCLTQKQRGRTFLRQRQLLSSCRLQSLRR